MSDESDGKIWDHLSRLLLVLAIALASFVYGSLVVFYKLFPSRIIVDSVKTLQTLHTIHTSSNNGEFLDFTEVPLDSTAANRFQFVQGDSLSGPILWQGGRYQFLEYCPDEGCLAVEYAATGEVAHAYPLRSAALEQAADAAYSGEFPYEVSPASSFARGIKVDALSRYANGDLLVVFRQSAAFPARAGVARVDRAGHPVWFRRDYSHHWPYIDNDGVALVPGALVGRRSISFERAGKTITLECGTGRPYLDAISMIDEHGQLLKRINLIDALRDSPFAHIMLSASRPAEAAVQCDPFDLGFSAPCDPLHLNFIHRLGDDAGGAWGLAPGDLVASLRHISAFAILDGASGRIKRLVRGSFFYQHSVQHLTGSTFLMFDNYGGDGVHGPSRLLMLDLADSRRETTIFPNDRTPESLRNLFSAYQGALDISPDRRRVLVTFTGEGVAVEVRLADGAVLNVFKSLHNVSNLEQFSEERQQKAAIFVMKGGLFYIHNQRGASP